MINIATSADKKFLPYTYVMFFSVIKQHPDECIRFFLLHGGLDEEAMQPMMELCAGSNNQFVPLVANPDDFKILRQTLASKTRSVSAYFRLQLLDLLPADVDRILYLDVDIIVNKPLTDFYNRKLDGHLMTACPDMILFDPIGLEKRLSSWKEPFSSLLKNGRYFNSGVTLYDVAGMRKKYQENPYFKIFPQYENQIQYPDQDLLNIVHKDEVLLLDPLQYNCMPYIAFRNMELSYEELKEKAFILHFVGQKPWTSGNHIHYPAEKIWWETAFETIYSDELQMAFLESSLSDRMLEEEVRELYRKNSELREGLAGIKSSLEKIMGAVNQQD